MIALLSGLASEIYRPKNSLQPFYKNFPGISPAAARGVVPEPHRGRFAPRPPDRQGAGAGYGFEIFATQKISKPEE
ncbi:MAG: hypothetical protein DBX90_08100 [Lentisphaerae bacterium]|nr:MAG: hypothetical protein DBX90_08100 [Lentisphaerota bacterium]